MEGTTIGVVKEDTRSLDYGSGEHSVQKELCFPEQTHFPEVAKRPLKKN